MTESLFTAAKEGDKKASEELLSQNSGLIWSVARRFFGRGVEPDDLFQLGSIGFIKALRGFDEDYGTRFSTYAVPKIAGEIRRFLRDDGQVKVSRGVKERAARIMAARGELEQKLGREPRLSEISDATGLSVEDIALCETASASPESLDSPAGDEGMTLAQKLGDITQEEKLLENLDLKRAVQSLPETERDVILLRYWRGMTQERAARILGISQVQVSRLEKRAVMRLRAGLL